MTAAYDFKNEADVKEYLHNIGIEYRFGCYNEKKPEVCHLLAMYLENIKKNDEQAKKVYKVNCDTHKWSFSCYKYAYMRDVEKNDEFRDEIIDYYKRGCEAGYSKSCYLTGVRMGAKAEKEENLPDKRGYFLKALDYMNKACDDKVGTACFNLASIYFNGIPKANIDRDLTKVLQYSIKGCDNLDVNCCSNASLMYQRGEGTGKNLELANQYREKTKELYKSMTEQGLKFGEGVNY